MLMVDISEDSVEAALSRTKSHLVNHRLRLSIQSAKKKKKWMDLKGVSLVLIGSD